MPTTYLQGQGHLHLVIAILYVKVVTGVFTKTYVYMLQIRVHQSFLTVFRVLLLIYSLRENYNFDVLATIWH